MDLGSSRPNFVTFGGGRPRWRSAAIRLTREAAESRWFRSASALHERHLPALAEEVGIKWRMPSGNRGFGYWSWKPLVVLAALKAAPRNGTVIYLDAGCHFNIGDTPSRRFAEYLEICEASGGLAMSIPAHIEQEWTRKRVLDRLEVSREHRVEEQVAGGVVLLRKSDATEALAQRWLDLVLEDDGSLVRDDDIDRSREDPWFRMHRHDQSVYSCLVKAFGLARIPDETFFGPHWEVEGGSFPIWTLRHDSGVNPRPAKPLDRMALTAVKGRRQIEYHATKRLRRSG